MPYAAHAGFRIAKPPDADPTRCCEVLRSAGALFRCTYTAGHYGDCWQAAVGGWSPGVMRRFQREAAQHNARVGKRKKARR